MNGGNRILWRYRSLTMPAQSDLIFFTWPVDSLGYEWRPDARLPRRKGVRPVECLQPIGGRVEWKSPLEAGALHRIFANTPPTREGIKAFADNWGMLRKSPGSLDGWQLEIESVRTIVEFVKGGALQDACDRLNASQFTSLVPRLLYDPSQNTARIGFTPADLRDAIWFQAIQSLAANKQFSYCKWCKNPFPFGQGTPHRSTAKYCSARCRKNAFLKRQRMYGGSK